MESNQFRENWNRLIGASYIFNDRTYIHLINLIERFKNTDDNDLLISLAVASSQLGMHNTAYNSLIRALKKSSAKIWPEDLQFLIQTCLQKRDFIVAHQILDSFVTNLVISRNKSYISMSLLALTYWHQGLFHESLYTAISLLYSTRTNIPISQIAHEIPVAFHEQGFFISNATLSSLTEGCFNRPLLSLDERLNTMPIQQIKSRNKSCFSTFQSPLSLIHEAKHFKELSSLQKRVRIKAIIHAYSEDSFNLFIKNFCGQLISSFEVYLTTSSDLIATKAISHGFKVEIIPNIGLRDYASKFLYFWDLLDEDELCLFTHCKNSSYAGMHHANSQLFSPEVISSIGSFNNRIPSYNADQSLLGLLLPSPPPFMPSHIHNNKKFISQILIDAGHSVKNIELSANAFALYPVGNFYYASRAALRPLRELVLPYLSSLTEPLPRDGTILHAAERLVAWSASNAGRNTEVIEPF
jgi:hypothetical protein